MLNDSNFHNMEPERNKWISAFNTSSDSITELYSEKSGLLFNNEFVFERERIAWVLKNRDNHKWSIRTVYEKKIFKHNEKKYIELGLFETDNKENLFLAYITAWQYDSDKWFRDLDVLIPKIKNDDNLSELDNPRTKWVEHANAHDPEKLINSVYTENAVYLSNGKPELGRENIIRRYSYMSKEDFKIDLEKKHQLMVQPGLVFETGLYIIPQYTGYYIIVWEKQPDSTW